MDMIENRIFDEIQLGETASLVRTLSREDIELFAIMSGDVKPTSTRNMHAATCFIRSSPMECGAHR